MARSIKKGPYVEAKLEDKVLGINEGKSKKGVITSDREICGNIIGEREGAIIVEKGVIHEYIYRIPRSNIEAYDSSQIILNIPLSNLNSFEEKRNPSAESAKVDSSNTATQLKDTVTDTISGTVNKVKDLVSGNNNNS